MIGNAVKLGRRIGRAFFEGPCAEVARALVGTTLVRILPGGVRIAGRLVEVEAYVGDGSDPAAHSHRGQTPRNCSMFGPAGRIYAYRCYGLHTCLNVVCEPAGSGAAVLLRAIEPLCGLDIMRAHRGFSGPDTPERASEAKRSPVGRRDRELARGPGRLTRALGLDLSCDGASLTSPESPFRLHLPPAGCPPTRVETSGRVGLSVAGDLPHRFFEPDSPWVSPYRSGGRKARRPKADESSRERQKPAR